MIPKILESLIETCFCLLKSYLVTVSRAKWCHKGHQETCFRTPYLWLFKIQVSLCCSRHSSWLLTEVTDLKYGCLVLTMLQRKGGPRWWRRWEEGGLKYWAWLAKQAGNWNRSGVEAKTEEVQAGGAKEGAGTFGHQHRWGGGPEPAQESKEDEEAIQKSPWERNEEPSHGETETGPGRAISPEAEYHSKEASCLEWQRGALGEIKEEKYGQQNWDNHFISCLSHPSLNIFSYKTEVKDNPLSRLIQHAYNKLTS